MDKVVLMYEEPELATMAKPVEPLINHLLPSQVLCEKELCPAKATDQWTCRDQDGELFYTYRCDDHPADAEDRTMISISRQEA